MTEPQTLMTIGGMPLARIKQIVDFSHAAAAQEVEAYWAMQPAVSRRRSPR